MKFVRANWFVFLLAFIILIIFIFELLLNAYKKKHDNKTPANKEVISYKYPLDYELMETVF